MATKTPEAPTAAPDAPSRDNPWTNKWTLLSAVLVASLVLAAVWLAVTRPSTPADPGPQPGSAAPSPALAALGCGPAARTQIPPSTAPATTWRLLGGIAAPYSKAAGPARVNDDIPVCFSPGPVGALFAAATFTAASSDPDLRLPALAHLVAPGPGKQAAMDASKQAPGTRTVGVQIAGFSFLSYRPAEAATIDLALSTRGQLLHVPLQLRWIDGDWRVVLPVTGRPFDALAVIPSLAGYVPWQGA